MALEESHNDGHAKLKKDLDHALVVSRVLNSEKAKLGVDLARLKEEFDILDKAHKALKGAHANLKESHDQLQVKLTKEKATFPHMVLIDNANATNPCCEHVYLVEENAKLNYPSLFNNTHFLKHDTCDFFDNTIHSYIE